MLRSTLEAKYKDIRDEAAQTLAREVVHAGLLAEALAVVEDQMSESRAELASTSADLIVSRAGRSAEAATAEAALTRERADGEAQTTSYFLLPTSYFLLPTSYFLPMT